MREEQNISWWEVSKRTGLSRPTLHRLGKGKGNPSLQSLIALAHCFRTSVSNLLGTQSGFQGQDDGSLGPFLATPPAGDPRAMAIYQAVCREAPPQDIFREVERMQFSLPGESLESSVSRAVVDVFHYGQAWIDHAQLPRCRQLEEGIASGYKLERRQELEDGIPVRVIDISQGAVAMLQIHALAVVAAALIRELMRHYRILGFADGYTVSAIQKFIRRGDLTKTELVPLTHTPRYAQFELSGATLIGAMARAHQSYQVRSTIELAKLQDRIREVQVAVTSCGSVEDRDRYSRLARLIREACPDLDYLEYIESLKKRGIAGELLYHFMTPDGFWKWRSRIPGSAHDIEKVSLRRLQIPVRGDPSIYSVSPEGMARIARRGVCLLTVHSPARAAIARAALLSGAVNFIITTKAAAEKILELQAEKKKRGGNKSRRSGR